MRGSTWRYIAPLLLLIPLAPSHAAGELRLIDPEDRTGHWSLGFSYFLDASTYAGGEDLRRDLLPTFVYTGERIFMDGTNLGWYAIDNDEWQVDVFGSYYLEGYNDHTFYGETGASRPADDPLAGMERKNSLDAGLEVTRKTDLGRFGLEFRQDASDVHNGGEIRGRWAKVVRGANWQIEPWAQYSWLSEEKANYYFGVTSEEATQLRPQFDVAASNSWSLGIAGRYTLQDQHHLNINLGYQSYGGDIVDSPIVERSAGASVQLGYRYELGGLRDTAYEDGRGHKSSSAAPWSVRLGSGCTNDTRFIDMLTGDLGCSYEGTGLASLFVARRLSDEMLSLPIEAWLQTGVARRFENGIQDDFWEGIFAIKAVYRGFPWSDRVDTRVGFSNGVSYASSIPAIEAEKALEKNRRTNHLLHYLEFSFDFSIGDLLGVDKLRDGYLGMYIHHRSGVFGNVDAYNNVYGGSNTNGFYIEWEFN